MSSKYNAGRLRGSIQQSALNGQLRHLAFSTWHLALGGSLRSELKCTLGAKAMIHSRADRSAEALRHPKAAGDMDPMFFPLLRGWCEVSSLRDLLGRLAHPALKRWA